MAGLISLAEAEAYLEVASDTGGPLDTLVNECINSASEFFDTYTNRRLRQGNYTHQMDGTGQHVLKAREWPITAITTINLDSAWVFGGGTLVAATDYFVDSEALIVGKNVWSQGIRNYKVVYTAGYSTAPQDLKHACLLMVEFLFRGQNDQRLGIQSRSKIGETLTFFEDMPKPIFKILDQYERKAALKNAVEAGG